MSLKILHTADWHLGQKFKQNHDRIEEHRKVLDWLLTVIQEEKIDILIVAGDIFDTPNPPNNARELYYKFLVDAANKGCRHTIIIAGNHDSPSMLNAPKGVLSAIKTYVVGCATDDIQDEIIPLYDDNKQLEAVIAAVPFLRDRDLKSGIAGEGGEDRITRIKEGIKRHYEAAAEATQSYKNEDAPIIATGHLYAKGANASSRQDNIYIGNMENITAEHFPTCFDYVALGHIHKAQVIGKQERIRYSGSLIPMNFGEWKDDKSITIIEFQGKEIQDIRLIPVPVPRKLVAIKGDSEKVETTLQKMIEEIKKQDYPLEAWVEIWLTSETTRPDIMQHYTAMVKDSSIRILRVSYDRQRSSVDALSDVYELDDLQPIDIFKKKCEAVGMDAASQKKSIQTFKALLNWMEEQDDVL